jgi:hypothetical protein
MGKFATYAKRGSSAQLGSISPPASADWGFGTVTTTSVQVTAITPFPLPATQYRARYRITGVAGWTTILNPSSTSPITATGLTPATSYDWQTQYMRLDGGTSLAVSDWSATKVQATP